MVYKIMSSNDLKKSDERGEFGSLLSKNSFRVKSKRPAGTARALWLRWLVLLVYANSEECELVKPAAQIL